MKRSTSDAGLDICYCNSFIKFLGNLRIELSIMFVCGGILSKRLLGILPDNLIFLLLILISLIDSSLLDSLSLSGSGSSDNGESGVGEEAGVGGVGDGGGGHVAGDVLDGAGDQVVQAVLGLLKLDLLGVGGGGGVNRLEGSGLVGQGLKKIVRL